MQASQASLTTVSGAHSQVI